MTRGLKKMLKPWHKDRRKNFFCPKKQYIYFLILCTKPNSHKKETQKQDSSNTMYYNFEIYYIYRSTRVPRIYIHFHVSSYAYASTFSLNPYYSKTTTPTKFIFTHLLLRLVPTNFGHKHSDQWHTWHTKCQNVPKKPFHLKIFFSRTESGTVTLNTVLDS